MELRLGPLTLTRTVEMNVDRETSAPLGCLVHDRQMIARLHQSKLRNKRQRRKMCSSKKCSWNTLSSTGRVETQSNGRTKKGGEGKGMPCTA